MQILYCRRKHNSEIINFEHLTKEHLPNTRPLRPVERVAVAARGRPAGSNEDCAGLRDFIKNYSVKCIYCGLRQIVHLDHFKVKYICGLLFSVQRTREQSGQADVDALKLAMLLLSGRFTFKRHFETIQASKVLTKRWNEKTRPFARPKKIFVIPCEKPVLTFFG